MPKIFTEQEREIIRNKLLDAGIKALSVKHYRDIKVDEIASAIGIAKGTFYNFFQSKEIFFYEIIQTIKEKNRISLRELFDNNIPLEKDISALLYHRYTQIKTVYDYFSPEEMKLIVRKLPQSDLHDDSVEFARQICEHFAPENNEKEYAVIVAMCNILGLAASNKSIFETIEAYESAVSIFCDAIAKHICRGKEYE